jgi:hypothetical protein
MRQLISGLVAAVAVMTVGAVPAMACGGGLFQSSCSPCGQAYVSPCAQPQVYVQPAYTGCNTGCGGWTAERLPDPVQEYTPVHQYYYADQGPTYSGPGNYAPYPTYREGGYGGYHHRSHYGYGYGGYHRSWHHTGYGYGARYGYHHGFTPRHGMYGAYAPHHYGYRGYPLRRYY